MSDLAASVLGDTTDTSTGALGRTRAYRPWVPSPDTRRPMLVDVVATAVLALLVVHAFAPTYGGTVWWTIGGLGVVAGLVVAYAVVQLRLSPLPSVLAVLVGFVAFGGHAVDDTAIAGWLPGPGTPGALFDGITHGWARLLTTVPPVGTIDHLAAIVYLAGLVTSCGGLLLARRLSNAWLPVVPGLVVLLAAILVGTDQPASVIAQGAGVALVTLVWVSLRTARLRPRVHVVGSSAWGRRLTGVVFVALLLGAGLLIDTVQPVAGPSQRYVLRRHTEPPFDPSRYPSPLSNFRTWREAVKTNKKTPTNDPVLTVRGLPHGVPVRVASMDDYDGIVWRVGNDDSAGSADRSGSGKFVRVGSDLNADRNRLPGQLPPISGQKTTTVRARVTADSYGSVWVPTLSGVESLTFTGPRSETLASGIRFNRVGGTAAVPGQFVDGDVAAESAHVPVVSYVGPGKERDGLVGKAQKDTAIALSDAPDDPKSKLANVAAELTTGAVPDYAKAKKLESALAKTGYYSDGFGPDANANAKYPASHGLDQLTAMFSLVGPDGERLLVGNAERYAAAMAQLARLIGLPARVVTGFREGIAGQKASGLPHRQGDTVTFGPDSMDAWVEIAFEDVGWVAFFPTPSRSRTDIPKPEPEIESPRQAEVQARPPVSPPVNPALLQDQARQKKDKVADEHQGFAIPGWLWTILKTILYPLLVLAAIVAVIRGLKHLRRTRRRTRGSPVDRVAGAWAEMLDHLRDLGTTVPRSGTRLEVAGGIPDETWEPVRGFAAGIDAAMFGPDDPSDESAESIWTYVETQRTEMLDGLERKRRWLVQLSLASLKPWR